MKEGRNAKGKIKKNIMKKQIKRERNVNIGIRKKKGKKLLQKWEEGKEKGEEEEIGKEQKCKELKKNHKEEKKKGRKKCKSRKKKKRKNLQKWEEK